MFVAGVEDLNRVHVNVIPLDAERTDESGDVCVCSVEVGEGERGQRVALVVIPQNRDAGLRLVDVDDHMAQVLTSRVVNRDRYGVAVRRHDDVDAR